MSDENLLVWAIRPNAESFDVVQLFKPEEGFPTQEPVFQSLTELLDFVQLALNNQQNGINAQQQQLNRMHNRVIDLRKNHG